MTVVLYAFIAIIILALPLVMGVLLRRRYRTLWLYFSVGAAAFFLSQVIHIPLNNWLESMGLIGPLSPGASNLLLTVVILGLTAGLSETLMRVVAFWLLRRKELAQNWPDGVMVGLGHGGLEAMIVAAIMFAQVASLAGLQGTDLETLNLSAEQMAALTTQLDALAGAPLLALLPLVERFLAILLHVTLSLLVWLAFKQRNALFVVAAIFYHGLIDGSVVYASQFIDSPWLLEGLLALLLLPGLAFIWWTRGRFGQRDAAYRPPPLQREWAQLFTMWRKEMVEQWRTWRIVIIVVIFLIFGLTSPLLARFTPELLKSIEGAEQFADLIPDPTAADAIGQYVKNLAQFGFILVILLGMGAIAGERERGTEAMILSKPVPRWAFVVSKYLAQGVVYLLAVLVAAAGTYFYTSLLFEPLQFWPFLLGAMLFWLWLMAFAAVTLLGSAAGRGILIAAGLAFAGSALLLVLGSIPVLGQFMPSGLLPWISQLGLPEVVSANWAALGGTVVVILFCLVTAVAVVERQEL